MAGMSLRLSARTAAPSATPSTLALTLALLATAGMLVPTDTADAQTRTAAKPAAKAPAKPAPKAPVGGVDPEDRQVVVADIKDEAAQAIPLDQLLIPEWTKEQARELLTAIRASGADGLNPADYRPADLEAAIAVGKGPALDALATELFAALATHRRDGRTPNHARKQWFVRDTDAKATPMAALQEAALRDGVAATLATLDPVHPAFAALKAELAKPGLPAARKAQVRVNMERWRWMPRALGNRYILSNVPEFESRVVEKGIVLARHRAVVGKKTTPTPQLDARATAIILNPTWTLPRSIINEGIGNTIATRPAVARAQGYTWTGKGPTLSVVQQPGKGNALGVMKLEMLNEHAIYLHDTPSKSAFNADVRAFSHGCIRTDRALHFSGLMAVRYGKQSPEDFGNAMATHKTQRIAFEDPFPVYVTYWTMMPSDTGGLVSFADLYGRDAPVVASLAEAPRPAERARKPQPIMPLPSDLPVDGTTTPAPAPTSTGTTPPPVPPTTRR